MGIEINKQDSMEETGKADANILTGDAVTKLKEQPDQSIQTVITSPPYFGLRDYGVDGQIGMEATPEAYVNNLVEIFRHVWQKLRNDGTVWLNLGDSYCGYKGENYLSDNNKSKLQKNTSVPAEHNIGTPHTSGLKQKDLIGIPWRVAFALQQDGWYLRQDIIWHKPAPMPESVTDRCTKAHEYIFLLTKSERYYYNHEAIKETSKRPNERQSFGGKKARENQIEQGDPRYRNGTEQWGRTMETAETRNKRSVWTINPQPFKEAHFAVFPPELIEPCVLAAAPEGGMVCDVFAGSGTTGEVALRANRNATLIEMNPDYVEIMRKRLEPFLTQKNLV